MTPALRTIDMRFTPAGALFAAWLLASAPAASRQAPPTVPPAQPTFRTGVGAVRMDVTVIGRDGLPVLDLRRDEFEVREDGVVQPIQLFDRRTLTGEPPADSDESLVIRSPEHAAQEAAREDIRLLVLFIDDYHLKFGTLDDTRLRRALAKFVRAHVRPLDLVAVMGPLTPLSDLGLTRDQASLIKRINTLEGRLGGFVPPRSAIEEAHLRFAAGDLHRIRAQVTLSALHALAVHLGGLREGRKSILFVSQGPPTRAGGLELFTDLQEVIAAANRNNVVVHTLDPRQLGEARAIGAANDALSSNTGGRRIGLTNDFSEALRGVMSDASSYYMLGYESPRPAADGKFRDVDVRVARRGVRVIARSGYWAPRPEEVTAASAAAVAAAPPSEVSRALDGLKDLSRRVAVVDWIGVMPAASGPRAVTLMFELLDTATTTVSAIEAEVVTSDGVKTVHAPPEAPAGFWSLGLEAPPGPLKVRVSAKNAAGDVVDGWSREVTVPGGADSLGTPVVYRPASVAQFRALMAGSPVPPSARRRFRRTDRAIVRLAGAPDSGVRAELLNRQGAVLRSLAPSPAPAPRGVQFELPLGGLAQADYVLRFTAPGAGGAAARLLAFTVAP